MTFSFILFFLIIIIIKENSYHKKTWSGEAIKPFSTIFLSVKENAGLCSKSRVILQHPPKSSEIGDSHLM